jgi:hypothetical protein
LLCFFKTKKATFCKAAIFYCVIPEKSLLFDIFFQFVTQTLNEIRIRLKGLTVLFFQSRKIIA